MCGFCLGGFCLNYSIDYASRGLIWISSEDARSYFDKWDDLSMLEHINSGYYYRCGNGCGSPSIIGFKSSGNPSIIGFEGNGGGYGCGDGNGVGDSSSAYLNGRGDGCGDAQGNGGETV